MDDNKLFYKSQYGFRKGHSTEFAALELIDKLAYQMDKGKNPITIFLDLSKAFDTLNHDILHTKLSYYGVKGLSNNLIQSYLANRKSDQIRYVAYNHWCSTSFYSGPFTIFNIYINDITNASNLFEYTLYVDDSTLCSTLDSSKMQLANFNNINVELQKISEWLEVNKLSLNANKSKYMIFHYPQKNFPDSNLK